MYVLLEELSHLVRRERALSSGVPVKKVEEHAAKLVGKL